MMIGGSDAATELSSLALWSNKAAAIGRSEREDRIRRAQGSLDALGVDALLVNAGPSLRYFSGVTWEPSERMVSLVIQKDGRSHMICPRFELESLDAELDVSVDVLAYEEDEDPITLLADILSPETRFALDPLLPFTLALRLAARWNVVDGARVIDGLRACKSPAELALIRQAMAMTLEVQRRAALILKPGIHASEVERFIDEAHRAVGSSGSTFCSVQFGSATAVPHGLPYDQELSENELVLIDTGCTVDGYHSDLTRCYAFGNIGDDIRAMWALNKAAQAAAFAAVQPGVPCAAIDDAARSVLVSAGLGPDYRLPGLPHRTGHGIGLCLHEPPYLVRGDMTPLAPGMCFSNEPMIVVPDRFGISLEDHFMVTEAGAEWFTTPQMSIDRPFA